MQQRQAILDGAKLAKNGAKLAKEGGKIVKHSGTFVKHVVPAVVKPIHSLWNEVIGFFFLVFAVSFAFKSFRSYRAYLHDIPANAGSDLMAAIVTAIFTVVMASFGISAFLKARRISRS